MKHTRMVGLGKWNRLEMWMRLIAMGYNAHMWLLCAHGNTHTHRHGQTYKYKFKHTQSLAQCWVPRASRLKAFPR